MDDDRPSAPNYTTAVLWMGLVNLLWMLGVIWAMFGMPAVLATGYALNRGISWLSTRMG